MTFRYQVAFSLLALPLLFDYGLANAVAQDYKRAEPQAEAQKKALEQAFAKLDQQRALILEKYNKAHLDLLRQLESLEKQRREALVGIEEQKTQLKMLMVDFIGRPAKAPAGVDFVRDFNPGRESKSKLDQILDRLSAIEKRLDILENRQSQQNRSDTKPK